MATSGTVGSTIFLTQQIIDHAFRRCKIVPQEITSEHIITARDLLWLYTQTLVNKGIKLWNVERIILPMYQNTQSVPVPLGTVDVLDVNLRTQTRITGTASASEGVADNAFDGNINTACTQTLVDGTITMDLTSAQEIFTFGILPNVSGTWTYVIEASNDAFVTSTTLVTRTAQAVVAQEWLWVDVEGVIPFTSYRLRATGGATILDVAELVYQNTPQEIPFYQLNRTDYSNLPDKSRGGRPTQYWWDRQRTLGIMTIWPSPNFEFTFAQLTCYIQRQMQDVGTLTQELEVPDRWYLAIVCQLSKQLAREIKEVDPAMIPIIDRDAQEYLDDAWAGEGDGSDIFWRPNISPYTR